LLSYGLDCNGINININLIIWSKGYKDEQV